MPLFNSVPFNKELFDGPPFSAATIPTDLVVFDGYSLADNSVIFCTDLKDSAPSREILGGNVPRDDGQYVTADYWREKRIEVVGFVKKSTNALLETELDTIRKRLAPREQYLDITRNSITRRYIASLENPQELFGDRKGYHITVCPFQAVFVCKEPFATDTDYTAISEDMTSSPHNTNFENTGTIHADPVVIIIFSAASSVTALSFQNVTNGETITYTGSIAATDIIEIDCENKTFKKNGTEVNYTGAFPKLDPGGNILRITVTGTSYTAYGTWKSKYAYL